MPEAYRLAPEDTRVAIRNVAPSRITPDLFLGNWDSARNKFVLRRLGVTHVICIAHGASPLSNHCGTNTRVRRYQAFTSPGPSSVSTSGLDLTPHALFQDFAYLHIEIDDTANEPISTYFPRSNQFISEAIQKGGKVLVHWYVLLDLLTVFSPTTPAPQAFLGVQQCVHQYSLCLYSLTPPLACDCIHYARAA